VSFAIQRRSVCFNWKEGARLLAAIKFLFGYKPAVGAPTAWAGISAVAFCWRNSLALRAMKIF
jgi:hypothetical protein